MISPISKRVALATLALGCAVSAVADVERTCTPFGDFVESWGVIPAGGLRIDLAKGIGSASFPFDTRPAPGFPNNAVAAMQCSLPTTALPIEQSIANAANVWNNATVAGSNASASSFMINPAATRFTGYPDFMTWTLNPVGSSPFLNGVSGRNLVTFWEHPVVMGGFGGVTLGVANVSLGAGGNIVDADIAFNAFTSDATGRPLFRYIEDNVAFGGNVAPRSFGEEFNQQTPGIDPVVGYVDLLGTLVHEFGHLAGLAHSLVDGPTSLTASETPTMFAVAQTQPFTAQVIPQLTGCAGSPMVPANGANTQFGGIVGVPARDLKSDDISAISVAYPGAGQTQLGSISGQVLDAAGNPVRGAHLVAINAALPEVHRVGVLSDRMGNYTIGSLIPGSYFVMAEGADVTGYFAGTQLPEFIDPAFACGGPPVFETEFLDAAESSTETTPLAGQSFVVNANATTNVAAFRVEPVSGLRLGVAACNAGACGASSARGAVHNGLGGALPTMDLDITGGAPNGLGFLVFGVDRIYGTVFGQLLETNAIPGVTVTVPLDGAGAGVVSLPVGPGLVGTTFYMQGATIDPATGGLILSSTVTLRFDSL